MVPILALPGQLTIPVSDNWGSARFEQMFLFWRKLFQIHFRNV